VRPQAVSIVPAWHTPRASQQPNGQVFASHVTGSTQAPPAPPSNATHDSRPCVQSTQEAPSRPHAVEAVPAVHTLAEQHPWQLVGPHGMTHCWPMQASPPLAHEAHAGAAEPPSAVSTPG